MKDEALKSKRKEVDFTRFYEIYYKHFDQRSTATVDGTTVTLSTFFFFLLFSFAIQHCTGVPTNNVVYQRERRGHALSEGLSLGVCLSALSYEKMSSCAGQTRDGLQNV